MVREEPGFTVKPYDAHLPVELVARLDTALATIRDSVNKPISDLKEALQNGESPEHLFLRCQMITHEDVHRVIADESMEGCQILGQTLAHLLIRVAKLEMSNDARTTNS